MRLSGLRRIASGGVSAALAVGLSAVAHLTGRLAAPTGVARALDVVAEPIAGLLVLGCLGSLLLHLASESRAERWVRAPIAFVLVSAGVVLLLGG